MSKTPPKAASGGVAAGRRPVAELLRARRREVERIYVAPTAEFAHELDGLIAESGVSVSVREPDELARLAALDAHQGIVAVAAPIVFVDVRELVQDASLLIVLDRVSDPQNLGAVLRVADACGADGVVMADRHSAPMSAATLKAAAGAAEWVQIARPANLANAIELAKKEGLWAIGLEVGGEPVGRCALFDERVAIVAGAEGGGLRRRTREICDVMCEIPMLGSVGSLNVATSVALAAYRAVGLDGNGTGAS